MPDERPLALMFRGAAVRALVVGAGPVGVRRARTLLEAGASVRVVALQVSDELSSDCEVHRRAFAPADLDGRTLAIAATDAADVNEAVLSGCRERGIPCCRADDAAKGDFTFPATADEGGIAIAIRAGSPAMSRRALTAAREAVRPHAAHAAAVAELRPQVLAATTDPEQRRAALADASSEEAAEVVRSDGLGGLRSWLWQRHSLLES